MLIYRKYLLNLLSRGKNNEPTGPLDSKTAIKIMRILIDLNKKGKTVIVTTHDKHIAQMCGKIIYINDGVLE